jgi:hypothetical protein
MSPRNYSHTTAGLEAFITKDLITRKNAVIEAKCTIYGELMNGAVGEGFIERMDDETTALKRPYNQLTTDSIILPQQMSDYLPLTDGSLTGDLIIVSQFPSPTSISAITSSRYNIGQSTGDWPLANGFSLLGDDLKEADFCYYNSATGDRVPIIIFNRLPDLDLATPSVIPTTDTN